MLTSAQQAPGTTRTLLVEKDAGGSVVSTVRRTVNVQNFYGWAKTHGTIAPPVFWIGSR